MSLFSGARAAAAPYALYIKLALIAVALGAVFYTGMKWQAGRDAKEIGELHTSIASKDAALGHGAQALRAAARALKAQSDATAQAVLEEQREVDRAKESERLAKLGELRAQQDLDMWRKQRETSMKREACRILLTTDVRQTCGAL